MRYEPDTLYISNKSSTVFEMYFKLYLRNKYAYEVTYILEKCHFSTCEKIIRSPFARDFLKKCLQRIWMFDAVSVIKKSIPLILKTVEK